MTRITEQLADLQRHIRTAAERAGRDPEGVRILAVSKRQPAKAVREARAAGLSDFGENYVQEALDKIAEVGGDAAWHFIGRIQSNKTRPIAEHFTWVHTVTDRRTAERLSAQRPERMDDLQVCIQVRPLDAGDRAGVEATDVPELAAVIGDLPGIRLRGLMMMPLPRLTDEDTRREYARTRKLLESLREGGYDLDTLSMGMSSDLETAVAEGSTLLRIGTAIFGPRK